MDLLDNPFHILCATTRDDRRRIVDLGRDEKHLFSEDSAVSEAVASLTIPRRRLAAEAAWLPGIGPAKAAAAVSSLDKEPDAVWEQQNLPPLARANLLAAGLVRAAGRLDKQRFARWLVALASADSAIDAPSTQRLINEERRLAGFTEEGDIQAIETALAERRTYYERAMKQALDQLSSRTLVEVITFAVEDATDSGKHHAPPLIDDLVDYLEVAARGFLDQESTNIFSLIQRITAAADSPQQAPSVSGLIGKLETVLKNWDFVAQPIQVSYQSRGLGHELSQEIAGELRGLAVDLYNKHGLLQFSQKITGLIQEVFSEVGDVMDKAVEDARTLDALAEDRERLMIEAKTSAERWRRDVTYEAEWGLLVKNKLRISPDGVEWNGGTLPLDSISKVRWGGTRHSVNGIPTGTTYSIVVAGTRGDAVISLSKEDVYSQFIERLWKAVGVRMLTEMLEGLREGRRYRFGSAMVDDFGVEFERTHLFSANERVRCQWTDLVIGNGAGTFYIAKKSEEKVAVNLSYQDDDNVHILEAALRVFWKNAEQRLSSLLSHDK